MDAYVFPPEFVNPRDKEKPEYGLQYARACYYTENRYGTRIFNESSDFDSLIALAQGRQSVQNMRKLFGFHRTGQTRNDGPESLAYIDPQVLNLVPKYVNRAVEKMQLNGYDIGLEAIDLLSVNEKADYASQIKSFYRLRTWVQMMGIPMQAAFPDIDISTMPEFADELLYDINTNPKLKREIAGEMGLKLIMAMNNFKQKMREVDWDLVVIGRGHLHTYLDSNKIPRVERIDPKYWGGSYVDNDNFEEQEYAFFIDCITVNQFIREASPFYKQADLQRIAQERSIRNTSFLPINQGNTLRESDNLNYIPVLRFYFRSEDNRTFVTRRNQYGSKTFMERSFDYNPTESTMERIQNGELKTIKNTYTTIYGGTWIIDSDVVYNYGPKKTPRTNLVEATLPIKTFATNFKDGRCVSFVSQMIEPVYMINVAWNKIKAILAKEWMGQREIDFNQIENVGLGKGGKEWSAREVFEFLEMSNTLVKRGDTNPYGQSNGKGINYIQSGVALADYFTALSVSINLLEQLTGATLVEQSETPNRLLKSVMQASQHTGDLDMGYLYNGHEYLYERTAHQLLLLLQEAKRDKAKISGFIPSLGRIHTGAYDVPDDVAYCEYGMILSRQPSLEEWREFYVDVQIALKEGRIGPADSAFVREIDNLKQARQVLANREVMYRRQLAKEKQVDIQANMEANAQSLELANQSKMMEIEAEKQAKLEQIALQGQIDELLQNQKSEQEAILQSSQMQMKAQIEKQKGTDEILKQAVRNTVEKLKVEKRADKSPQD